MKQKKFSITYKDPALVELVSKTTHKTVAIWAIECVERVIPYFEEKYPEDRRPHQAIITLKAWIITGVFRMVEIRTASLTCHAAARAVREDTAARFVARAAGQAVATAHVRTHAIDAANYALQAIYIATDSTYADTIVAKEREWQHKRLLELGKSPRH